MVPVCWPKASAGPVKVPMWMRPSSRRRLGQVTPAGVLGDAGEQERAALPGQGGLRLGRPGAQLLPDDVVAAALARVGAVGAEARLLGALGLVITGTGASLAAPAMTANLLF